MVSNRWSRTRFKTPKYEALVSSGSQKGTKRFFKRLLFSRKLNKQRALRAEQEPDAAGTTNQLDRYREDLRAFVTRDELNVQHRKLTVTVPVAKKPVYAIRTSQNRC